MAPKGRAEGPATVLAIGTANPEHFMEQSTYPDYLFGVTNSNHKVELKKKFQRMCDKSAIQKRHFHLTEEVVRANPEIGTYMHPSLDIRQDIAVTEVPRLAQEASLKAIEEWGRPKSDITHVVFTTTSSVDMPGADFQLVKLLGLAPTTQRVMMYLQGCFAGATVVRLAKDLAENNKGARVLAVCSEVTALTFTAPNENHLDALVGSALFGDGAAALIVGSDPVPKVERPLFEIHWAGERILPDSDGAINGHLRQAGLLFHLLKDVPGLVSGNIEQVVLGSFEDFEFPGYNNIFWAVHPGGRPILDQIEDKLKLNKDKFQASRDVLTSYGNMSSSAVIFALDNVRTRSKQMNLSTTGEGCEWGILLGFGPGMTIESVVLKSVPLAN